jgi:ABC-type sugar transport system ATPase subunit
MNPEPLKQIKLLKMVGMVKTFPGVKALRGVTVELAKGEILALLGENGAGKSTLIKILAGAFQPDTGDIFVDGQQLKMQGPTDSRNAGIAVIHQEFSLIAGLTASENIFLAKPLQTYSFIHLQQEYVKAKELLDKLGADFDPRTPCRLLSVAQMQIVEIAKALSDKASILVLDEPTAALTPRETSRLFILLDQLKKSGLGIIYVSHRLDEVFQIADRMQVLRDGAEVATTAANATTQTQIIKWMVGRDIEQSGVSKKEVSGKVVMSAKGLTKGVKVKNVSLEIREGEILGLTGLVGSGRTEVARILAGADIPEKGEISIEGRKLNLRSVSEAISQGIFLLTEDRKNQGLFLDRPVHENFSIASLFRFAYFGMINKAKEIKAFLKHKDSMGIRVSSPLIRVGNLSGGNQQKVLLARWLERKGRVFLLDEPTRGVDVGAKEEIYLLLRKLAAEGNAILLISSELPEVLALSDRILVMHEGQIKGEIKDVAKATQEQIMELAIQ